MTQIIKIKRSTTTAVPTTLQNGEMAYSAQSGKLFIGRPGGTTGDIDAIGGQHYTSMLDSATTAATPNTLVLRDGSGSIPGTIAEATSLATPRNFSATGDATAPAVAFDGTQNVSLALTLVNSGVTAGSYGSGTAIPVLTVDSKGRITAMSTESISTNLNIAGDTGTDSIALGSDTLNISGGTGVTTSVSSATNSVTLSIGQAVNTTSNVTFNNVTVGGVLNSDDITASTLTASGNVIVQGDLTVQGTTTTVNSTEVNIADNIIKLNSNVTGAPTTDSGILVERGTSTDVSLVWDESSDRWTFTNDGTVYHNIPLPSEYDDFGSFNVTVGGTTTSVGSGQAITFAGNNLTVSNSGNTVTYGVATATTAVKGIASFNSTDFTVNSGVVSVSNLDGGTF